MAVTNDSAPSSIHRPARAPQQPQAPRGAPAGGYHASICPKAWCIVDVGRHGVGYHMSISSSIGTCSNIYTITAVIEHVPMEVGT
jgi:hypothetical protein